MAIMLNCADCGKEFCTSVCSGSIFCDDCNGVNESKRQEQARWASLTVEEKLDELKGRIDSLDNRHDWRNDPIG
jgi:hypothetical protein